MPHCFKQVQRAHDIRFESLKCICPRYGGQTLSAQMEDMSRLVFVNNLRNTLTIAEIALHKMQVPGRRIRSMWTAAADYFPSLSFEKFDQVRANKSFGTGYK